MRRPCFAVIALVGLASPVEAASIFQSASLDSPLVFNQFDPSLGELDAVTFYLAGSIPLTYEVTSHLASPVIAPVTGTGTIGLSLPSGAAIGFTGLWGGMEMIDPGTNQHQFVVL